MLSRRTPLAAGPLDAILREATGEAAPETEIVFNGRQYCLGPYRYDRRADAESYAMLLRARPEGSAAELGPAPAPVPVEEPGAAAQEEMSALGITYEHGVYRLGEYRYDRLADAAAYARLSLDRG